jgi:hypothetical protein
MPSRVQAGNLVPASTVTDELTKLLAAPSSSLAVARFLMLAPSLDALAAHDQQQWLRRIATRTKAPLMAFHAQRLLHRHEHLKPPPASGFVWSVLGPLPAMVDGIVDFHDGLHAFPAPSNDGSVEIEGVMGPIQWQILENWGPAGGGSVTHLVPTWESAGVHVVTAFEISRREQVVIRLGAAGHVAASIDGRFLGHAQGMDFAHPDQLQAMVSLSPGKHVLSLSFVTEPAQETQFFVRLTDLKGRKLSHLVMLPAHQWETSGAIEPHGAEPVLTWSEAIPMGCAKFRRCLLASVARRALGIPDPQPGRGDRGELLEDLLLRPEAMKISAHRFLLLLEHVRRDEARSSILLHRKSRMGKEAPLLLAEAELAAQRGQGFRAQSLLGAMETAKNNVQDSEVGQLVSALVVALAGDSGLAARLLGILKKDSFVGSERMLTEMAAAAAGIDRPDLVLDISARLHRAFPGDLGLAANYVAALDAEGFGVKGLELLMTLARARPDLPTYRIEAARVAELMGEAKTARRFLQIAERAATYDPDLMESIARLWEVLGQSEEAKKRWRRVVALRPSDVNARRALERYAPKEEEPFQFEVPYHDGLLELPTRHKAGDFEILVEESHFVLSADGGYRQYLKRILRVHRTPEERRARTLAIRFDPDRENPIILMATIHREGRSLPVIKREIYQISEEWYGLYYDRQEMVVPFDDLRPGDTVEVAYRLDVRASRVIPGTFSRLETLQEHLYKHEVIGTVWVPPGMKVETRITGRPSQVETTVLDDGSVRHRLHLKQVPPLAYEHAMPGLAETGITWQITTFASWKEIADGYRRLALPQRVTTPAMGRWVEEQVASSRGPDGEISTKRLLRQIVQGTTRMLRYVGLEFGVHGYKPYRTDHVWVRRFGDCKDQATLLTELLKLAGITAHVVLLRSRGQGRVSAPLPSLALFDHAIVYVPDEDLFVDPTARFHELGDLPTTDQGAQALVVGLESVSQSLVRTPITPATRNGMDAHYVVTFNERGAAQVDGSATFRGFLAADYRQRFANADSEHEALEKLLNRRYPGLRLLQRTVADPEELSKPFSLDFVAEVEGLARHQGGRLQIDRPAGWESKIAELVGTPVRDTPLLLGPPATYALRFQYVPPRGWSALGVPDDKTEAGLFGEFSVRWVLDSGEVRVNTRLQLLLDQVAPEDYSALRAFLYRFDDAIRAPLLFEKTVNSEVRP